jgi:hypothetical protein
VKPLRGKRAEPKRTAREGQSLPYPASRGRHVRTRRVKPVAAGGSPRKRRWDGTGAPPAGLCRDRLRTGPWRGVGPFWLRPEGETFLRFKRARSGAEERPRDQGRSRRRAVTGEARGPRPLKVGGERGRLSSRPVLKHGPRSPARARVAGFHETRWRSESEGRVGRPRRDPVGRGRLTPPPSPGAPPARPSPR